MDILLKIKLLLENLPPSLASQRETLARCLEAMNRVMPLRAVYLFGSHARGEAWPDSDVDLCLVADGGARQLKAAQNFRLAMRPIPAKPPFTLVPIAPNRLAEKQKIGDFFQNGPDGRGAACHGRLTQTIRPTGFGLRKWTSK